MHKDVRVAVPTHWGDGFGSDIAAQHIARAQEVFGAQILAVLAAPEYPTDVPILVIESRNLVALMLQLKSTYTFLADITATDEGETGQWGRFEVVYQLFAPREKSRLRVKTAAHEGAMVPSLAHIWSGANWAEREVYDMFGVRFCGHPDMRRILMDYRWVGHPLRKDYPLKGYQLFPDAAPINPDLLQMEEQVLGHDSDELWDNADLLVNIGPTHPTTHGALRMCARLRGETIETSYCEFGYTHRAKEKLGENRTYHNFIVYTDRLNYCSSLINNVAYVMTVEKLMGIGVPDRCVWIRMIVSEIARIIDHLICVGINAVDLGAFSYFLYGYHQREEAYTLIEKLCGARLTTSYTRVGGLMADAPEGFEREVKEWVRRTRVVIDEMHALLTNNKIWRQRTEGVGVFTREQCMDYSVSGPCARAAGIDIDLRRDQPYLFYKNVEFDVPVCGSGDVFDRYLVRIAEIRESLNIITQCADRMKSGPIWTEDKRVRIPDKDSVHNTMEGMIHHFKFFMEGFQVPPGEAYSQVEAANGELGFYIVSRGGPRAHRMRIRGPSFWNFQTLAAMVRGQKVADMVAALGSINVIAGELDR